jgi:hypothetical protein
MNKMLSVSFKMGRIPSTKEPILTVMPGIMIVELKI